VTLLEQQNLECEQYLLFGLEAAFCHRFKSL
jgi:hypothetical protein